MSNDLSVIKAKIVAIENDPEAGAHFTSNAEDSEVSALGDKKKKFLSKRDWIAQEEAKPVTFEKAYQYAAYLLDRQDYTSGKMRTKLNYRFSRDTQFTEPVIEKLIRVTFINDEVYLDRYVQSLLGQKMGPSKIREKLYLKGFSSSQIAVGLEMTKEKDYFDDAYELKCRRFGVEPITDPKLKQKALGFLVRKGFDYSLSIKVVNKCGDDDF